MFRPVYRAYFSPSIRVLQGKSKLDKNYSRRLPLVFNALRMSSTFQEAQKKVKNLKEEPGNDVKLNLYGLYKQATQGSCTQPKPGVFDMIGKAKWDAWNSLGNMTQKEAEQKYAALVDELSKTIGIASEVEPSTTEGKYEGITYTVGPNITEIAFNRPQKKNAITTKMYTDIVAAMKEAIENDTAVTILTGNGDFFSSGNDLSNFTHVQDDLVTAAKNAGNLLRDFVAAFIDFPKILVAAVNGPAVGIPVTLLGLCDIVYVSEKATFQTPFSLLGQSPEGCSTYTFPKIMGYSKANEILLFNKKFTAAEAKEIGLVSEIFPHDNFLQHVRERLSFLPEASKRSMLYSKELSRGAERGDLHKANEWECQRLVERWQSPDCMEALMRFFQRKSKL